MMAQKNHYSKDLQNQQVPDQLFDPIARQLGWG